MIKNLILLSIVVVAAFAQTATSGSGSLSGSGSSSGSGSGAKPMKWKTRTLTVDADNKGLTKVTSVAGTGANRTISEWTISSNRGGDMRIRSSYMTVERTDNSKTVEASTFLTRFSAIIEFLDANGNGIFDKGEGLQVYRLGIGRRSGVVGIDWTTKYTKPTTPTGIHTLSATTNDGFFGVSVSFSETNQTIDGVIVPPTQIKFNVYLDFTSSGWQWVDTTGKSQIAILGRVVTKDGVATKEVDGSVKSGKVTKQFSSGLNSLSWADTLMADSTSVSVTTTGVVPPAQLDTTVTDESGQNDGGAPSRTGENSNVVIFSIGATATRPNKMTWDPTVGVDPTIDTDSASASTSSSSSVVVSMVVALVFAVATLLL